jgi:hypothetical protein
MYLIFETALHDIELLFEISGEGMQRRLGIVEERHDDCAVSWSDREAEGGVTTQTGLRELKGTSLQVAFNPAFRKL